MKKTSFFFFIFSACLFILQSCLVEKRRYTQGLYIQHTNSVSKKKTSSVTRETTVSVKEVKRKIEKEEITKYEAKKNLVANINSNSLPALQSIRPNFKVVKDSCDTLVLTNGTEILVKVLEIGPRLIRYKHCNNPDGPIYNTATNEVQRIIFSNGSKEEFKTEQPIVAYNPEIVSASRIRRTSILALVFGIISIPTLVFYLAGIVFAILAIKNANNVLRWYKREPNSFDPSVKSKAQIGLIFGLISLALVAIGIVALFMYFVGYFR